MTEHERIRPTTDEVRAALEEQMSKSRFGRRALKSQEGMDRAMTMLESEIGGSDLTREADGTLRISTAGADWPTAIFATFFLGFASVLSIAALLQREASAAAIGATLLLFGSFMFFRLLASETFTVDHTAVTIRSAVGPLGRTRRIPIYEIERVQAATETDGETQSRITIWLRRGRGVSCGWVSEYEAAEIARLIEERVERLR